MLLRRNVKGEEQQSAATNKTSYTTTTVLTNTHKEKPLLKNSDTQKSTLNRIVTLSKIHTPSDCRVFVRETFSKQGDKTVFLLLWHG